MVARRTPGDERWFIRQGDHVDGPHAESRIRAWHREGRIPDDVLLSRDGQTWHRVRWGAARRGDPARPR